MGMSFKQAITRMEDLARELDEARAQIAAKDAALELVRDCLLIHAYGRAKAEIDAALAASAQEKTNG